jgi:hypothetical protein
VLRSHPQRTGKEMEVMKATKYAIDIDIVIAEEDFDVFRSELEAVLYKYDKGQPYDIFYDYDGGK